MLHERMSQYLRNIEIAVKGMKNIYTEHYEEQILTPERVNLRIRIRFINQYLLALNEALILESGNIRHLDYRYHFQDNHNNLIFRYDNAPHFPEIETFPHHKHLKNRVIACIKPSILNVIEEAELLCNSDVS